MANAVGKDDKRGGLRLQGKVALITGGTSGIGEATVKLFVAEGAKVVFVGTNDAAGESVAREAGGPDVARYIHCDVKKEDEIAAAVDLCVSAYGGLDIMFNNAGIAGPVCRIDETPAEELDNLYSVNLRGVFLGMKHAARIMKPAQKGSIISNASIAAHAGGVAPHAYTTFKHAIVGLTRSAAFELRDYQIRVNCVSPGPVLTKIWNQVPGSVELLQDVYSVDRGLQSGITSAANIANVVLFLASNEAAFVSGHTLLVDGSYTVAPVSPHSGIFFPGPEVIQGMSS